MKLVYCLLGIFFTWGVAHGMEQRFDVCEKLEEVAHHKNFVLRSVFRKIIPMLSFIDCVKLTYLLKNDLLSERAVSCAEKHVICLKYVIDAMAYNPELYAKRRMVNRLQESLKRLNGGKNDDHIERVQKQLDTLLLELDKSRLKDSKNKINLELLRFLAFLKRPIGLEHIADYTHFKNNKAVDYDCFKRLSELPDECKKAIRELLVELYCAYNHTVTVEYRENMIDKEIHLLDQAIKEYREFNKTGSQLGYFKTIKEIGPAKHPELWDLLDCCSESELRLLLSLLIRPSLHHFITYGFIIKMALISSQEKSLVQISKHHEALKLCIMREIIHFDDYKKDSHKPIEASLTACLDTIEKFFSSKAESTDPLVVLRVHNMSPHKKERIMRCIKACRCKYSLPLYMPVSDNTPVKVGQKRTEESLASTEEYDDEECDTPQKKQKGDDAVVDPTMAWQFFDALMETKNAQELATGIDKVFALKDNAEVSQKMLFLIIERLTQLRKNAQAVENEIKELEASYETAKNERARVELESARYEKAIKAVYELFEKEKVMLRGTL